VFDQSKIYQFGLGQTVWESSFRGNPLFQFRQGVLSILWGGEPSKAAGLHTLESLKKEIPALLRPGMNPQPLETAMMNWEKATLFQGSVSYPQVGRQLQSGGPEAPMGWAWAGEHMWSAAPGTMEAALKSGIAAVEQILRQSPALSGKSVT
jgi:monoamine oxidase